MITKVRKWIFGLFVAGMLAAGLTVAPAVMAEPGPGVQRADAYSTSACHWAYIKAFGRTWTNQHCLRNYTAWEEWFQGGRDGWYSQTCTGGCSGYWTYMGRDAGH